MSRIRPFLLATGLALAAIVPSGCSEPPAESIEGKPPADYREEMEKGLASPVPKSPAKERAGSRR